MSAGGRAPVYLCPERADDIGRGVPAGRACRWQLLRVRGFGGSAADPAGDHAEARKDGGCRVRHHHPKGKSGPSYKLQVAIESITAGSISDFKGISLTGVPKGDSPTYVRVKMTNISGKSFHTSSLDPANAVQAVVGNHLGSSLIVAGYFARCPDADTPNPFKPGQTFTTCETYMQKGQATKIAYNGSSATLNSPIIWSR